MSKFIVDGLEVEVIKVKPTTDVRFFSQRQLFRAGTVEAIEELERRAKIINKR